MRRALEDYICTTREYRGYSWPYGRAILCTRRYNYSVSSRCDRNFIDDAMIRLALLLVSSLAFADNSQEGSLNTNAENSTVGSNNESSSSTTNYNGAGSSKAIPVGSAITPSYMANGVETCLQGTGGSLQTGMIGLSGGKFKEDPNCNRRRDSKVLSDLGMKVAAVARMCENIKVWESMFISGTPCPILTR